MPTEKLYSPLEFYLHNFRKEEASPFGLYDLYDERCKIPHEDALRHMYAIELAVRIDRSRMDSGCGLAEYAPRSLDDIVLSVWPSIELHGGKLWCVAEVELSRPATPGELGELDGWWTKQLSGGWGERFEQQEIDVGAETLYIVPWKDDSDFRIFTQDEFDRYIGVVQPSGHEVPPQRKATQSSVCLNGELQPGDMVVSTGDSDYSFLVGTVLSIDRLRTSEHQTENRTDDVHVNFMDADYSQQRIAEIQQMLGEMYGRPTSPGIWPPVDIGDVIMAPGMLLRITGIARETLQPALDSREGALAFVKTMLAGLRESPAQAALHEPDMFDDPATAALREKLIERLNGNLSDYFTTVREFDNSEIAGWSSEISAVTGAHYYLTEIHNFHTSELDYLLLFKDPLKVVADEFEANGFDSRSDTMWKIFDRQEALQGDYERVPAMETVQIMSEEELRGELNARLDDNLAEILNDLRTDIADHLLSNGEVTEIAERITAADAAHTYLTDAELTQKQMEYLLRFEYPLELVADRWPNTLSGLVDMSDIFSDILEDKSGHGKYKRFEDAPAPDEATTLPATKATEKPSVLDRIREATKLPREPNRDKPVRDKSGPEL